MQRILLVSAVAIFILSSSWQARSEKIMDVDQMINQEINREDATETDTLMNQTVNEEKNALLIEVPF